MKSNRSSVISDQSSRAIINPNFGVSIEPIYSVNPRGWYCVITEIESDAELKITRLRKTRDAALLGACAWLERRAA